jgi:isopentenyldiphosphate isomerase
MEELGVKVNPKKIMSNIDLTEFSVRLFFMLCNVEEGEPKITEPDEIDELRWMTFNDFFNDFSDNEIGHGLVWLRKNPELWIL